MSNSGAGQRSHGVPPAHTSSFCLTPMQLNIASKFGIQMWGGWIGFFTLIAVGHPLFCVTDSLNP